MTMNKPKEFQTLDGIKFYSLDSNRIAEYIKFFSENESEKIGLHVSPYHGFSDSDLDFLTELPTLSALFIQEPVEDMTAVQEMSSIEWLVLPTIKRDLDLSKLEKLKLLRADWSARLKGLESAKNLQTLEWWGFKPKSKSLESLAIHKNLKDLKLTQSNIETLKGLEQLLGLERLSLFYSRSLVDITALAHIRDQLLYLNVENCRKIAAPEDTLSKLRKLEYLGFSDCGEIASVRFVKHLQELIHVSLVGTKILDGDLTEFFSLPNLQHVGIDNKKHYSHSYEDFKKMLKD